MTLTCCHDHILTENIWFVWSETSYSGDKRRCYRCGTNNQPNSEDRATQPMQWHWPMQCNGSWRLSFAIIFDYQGRISVPKSLIPGHISLAHVKFKGVCDIKALQDLFWTLCKVLENFNKQKNHILFCYSEYFFAQFKVGGIWYPTTRIPNSSVTKKPGCNISGTESRIIKLLVAKRPGEKIWNKKPKKNENILKKWKKRKEKWEKNKQRNKMKIILTKA